MDHRIIHSPPAQDHVSAAYPQTPRSRKRRRSSADADGSLPVAARRSSRRLEYIKPESSCPPKVKSSSNSHAQTEAKEANNAFPFLKLPAELRVNVYRMALQRDESLHLHLERWVEEEIKADGTHIYRGPPPLPPPPPSGINVALLRTCALVYKEARQVLYGDNTFELRLHTGISTLSLLHQRSRSLIKSIRLTIPSHHDILDGFADLVRLGLRYCWGLKQFTLVLDGVAIDDRVYISGATSVYTTAFHILRFLPKGCKVHLEGNVSETVKNVIMEEGRLLEELDELSHLKRQHQMPDRQ